MNGYQQVEHYLDWWVWQCIKKNSSIINNYSFKFVIFGIIYKYRRKNGG